MSESWGGSVVVHCQCCRLPQQQRDRDGDIPAICDVCHRHKGERLETRLARAESHEKMLHERLDACRKSEQLAREIRDDARLRVASALSSRGRLAARIVEVAEEAGTHKCAAVNIGRDPRVIEMAEDYEARRPGGR